MLGSALAVLLVSRPLRLPPTLGFMLTGMLIGPRGLRWISDIHQVEVFADIGVTLLLFVIGLEFSISRLREYQHAFFVGGSMQVAMTLGAVYLIVSRLESAAVALVVGSMVALSSTAMVFRLLTERRDVSSPPARVMTGILLFQDFAMVPMIAMLPALAGRTARLGTAPSLLLGLAGAVLSFIAARYLMPRILGLVARSGVRELFVIGAIFICLGSSGVTAAIGLSAALGAFLAGILVSESEYAHQVTAEILPFRDLFNSLFFVSIGMLLDLRFVAANLPLVLGLSASVLAVKALIIFGVVVLIGYPSRVAVMVGLGLAQIGEFSFVIGRLGKSLALLTEFQYQAFLAAAVVSLGATPFLMLLSPHLGARLSGLVPRPGGAGHGGDGSPQLEDHVIIIGYGLNGRNLARVLKAVGLPYVAIDLDGVVVRQARREGEENLIYGDASREETLLHCGAERAAVVVFAIADHDSDRRGVKMVRSLNPSATIIVRTRLMHHVEELRMLGADEVIPEEFETSIAIFARVLRRLHVPVNQIRNQEQILRSEGYEFLRGGDLESAESMERISRRLAAGTTDSFLIEEGSPAIGKTVEQTALRAETGATIIALVRNGQPTVSPPPDMGIELGDVLILVGDHRSLEQAFDRLSAPPAFS